MLERTRMIVMLQVVMRYEVVGREVENACSKVGRWPALQSVL